MWQSSPSKFVQPHDDTCHDPPLTKLVNHTLAHHHLPPSHTWNPNPNFSPVPPSPCPQSPLSPSTLDYHLHAPQHDSHRNNVPTLSAIAPPSSRHYEPKKFEHHTPFHHRAPDQRRRDASSLLSTVRRPHCNSSSPSSSQICTCSISTTIALQ